jgi:chromate transporter
MTERLEPAVPLATIVREWGRIGVIGFGGPPAHIALFRKLCVDERGWLSATEFEDALAAANLLPGPASTQLAIFCAWRLRGTLGAFIGGLCFIVPGLIIILALAVLFLSNNAPLWVQGAAAGASAVVPVVALNAASQLARPSWQRANEHTDRQVRWVGYFVVGVAAAIAVPTYLVVILLLCGAIEIAVRREPRSERRHGIFALLPATVVPAAGGLAAVSWVALKVGALSYGGGFVIVPLMQHDAVVTYHWMTGAQFLSAVALGQITPGPVVLTVAAVGYAAGGVAVGLLAAAIAFAPSFLFVMTGAPHFDRVRKSPALQAFLSGAGAAVIGAIAGSSIPLGRELAHLWQVGILALALVWLFAFRHSVVTGLLGGGILGVIAVLAGAAH